MDNRPNRRDRGKKKPNYLALILAFLGLSYAEYKLLDPGEVAKAGIISFLVGLGLSALEAQQMAEEITTQPEVTEFWVLGSGGKSEENCPICIGFSDMGEKPLGYFPEQRAHATYCEEYCTCSMEYSDGQEHPEVQRISDWQEWDIERGFALE